MAYERTPVVSQKHDKYAEARRQLRQLREDHKKRLNLPPKLARPFERNLTPKGGKLGFLEYPVEVQMSALGLLCGLIALILPYWAHNTYDSRLYATWGLWSLCDNARPHCTTIHDNLVEAANVPVWYVLVQWSFLIGVGVSMIVFGTVGNCIDCKVVKLSSTTGMAVKCLSLIAAFEKLVSLYTFHIYSDEFRHWLTRAPLVEYHLMYYIACASCAIDVILAAYVFLNEEIVVYRPVEYMSPATSRYSLETVTEDDDDECLLKIE